MYLVDGFSASGVAFGCVNHFGYVVDVPVFEYSKCAHPSSSIVKPDIDFQYPSGFAAL